MSADRRITSKTGVPVEDLTLERVNSGWGDMTDFSIARETLVHQAGVAAVGGRRQVAENFRRAAELVNVPDDIILRIYDALRPFRSTHSQLTILAAQLKLQFHATECARWVEEAAEVYARRGLLKTGEGAGP